MGSGLGMAKANPSFRIAGVTNSNDEGKDIQGLLKRLPAGYKKNEFIESWNGYTKKEMLEYGYERAEFEGETIRGIVRLEPEPDNQYDSNAIKVFIKDVNDGEHHIGYIKKENTEEVLELMKDNEVIAINAEFTGGKYRSIKYDSVSDDEYYEEEELTRGLELTFVYKIETPVVLTSTVQPQSNSSKTKKQLTKDEKNQRLIERGEKMQEIGKGMQKGGGAMAGCGCLMTLLITVPIILIIIFFFL